MMNKSISFLILTTTLLFCCSSEKNQENSPNIPKNIKGVWNLKSRQCIKYNPEGISEWPELEERFNTVEIEENTISFYNYPYYFQSSYSYHQNSSEISVKDFPEEYTFNLKDSSLFITENYKVGDCLHFSNKFERSRGNRNQDTVDIKLLRTLKRDTINYSLLLGKWHLSTERNLNDGSDPIPLHFPFAIPHQLSFPNQKMDTTVSKQIITLNVNGKKRPFLISLDEYSFRLWPWHWELDCPEMIFYRE